MNNTPFSEQYWVEVWSRVRKASFLYQSQRKYPTRWLDFYNHVGDIWQSMSGAGPSGVAEKIVSFFLREQLLNTGDSILDVGCGPGVLSLAFAAQGFSVTALDASAKMVSVCREEARRRNLVDITVVEADWRSYRPTHPQNLVLASSFPQAMNPRGIRHLERWAKGYCGFLMGSGKDILPFRRQLWKMLMETPLQSSSSHLICTVNYLLTTGRPAALHRFSVPVCLHLPAASVVRYFQKYFAIFGKTGPEIAARIESEVTPSAVDGYLNFSGTHDLALVFWPVPRDPQR